MEIGFTHERTQKCFTRVEVLTQETRAQFLFQLDTNVYRLDMDSMQVVDPKGNVVGKIENTLSHPDVTFADFE